MIPVNKAPEPADFDLKVRKPGLAYLQEYGINVSAAPPKTSELPAYWTKVSGELWESYNRVCAYLCLYFEIASGASTTDHFVAKSENAGLAYEWENYRLACFGANRKKNRFDDVLDPFEIKQDTFFLNLATGEIKPNPGLNQTMQNKCNATIERLGLKAPDNNRWRAENFQEYLQGIVSESYLQRKSPFVWYEAHRQGLL